MREPNERLRAARQHLPSRLVPNTPVSRAELAEMVNTWLWERTGRRFELDDHLIGKWERGIVRFPIAPYRAALRATLLARSDADLGFHRPPRRSDRGCVEPVRDPGCGPAGWTSAAVVDEAEQTAESELINRRTALRLAATGGAALVGQLADVCGRLRSVPSGPLTDRAFLVAAELAKIAGSMAFDAGEHRSAQQHYVTAARLAKAGDNVSFGAVALAALARQSFDLGAADDGLQIVQLAQRGTRTSSTPRLRAMLASREAWAYAQLGDVHRFRQCVDSAETAHAESAAAGEPRWLRGFDAAELNGTIGARYRDLARHDRGQISGAVIHLSRALELRDTARARNRAFDLVSLGRAHLMAGAADAAAASVQQALPHLDHRQHGRLGRKLAEWYRESAPVAGVPSVAATRTAVRDLASVRAVDVEEAP